MAVEFKVGQCKILRKNLMTKPNQQREEDENRIVRLRSSQEKIIVDRGNIFQCPVSHERRGLE